MNRDQSRVPARRTARPAPAPAPVLVLDVERVLDVHARQRTRAAFRFDPRTPWTVTVELRAPGGARVVWHIGRELLAQGLREASGLGDVRLRPVPGRERPTVRLRLAGGDMAALFDLPAVPLEGWLEHTYALVPAADELAGLDWDAAGAALLDDEGAPSD